MRLLFTSFPGYGHVHPLMPLALAALAHGDEVLVATGADLVGWLSACGVNAAPAGLEYATIVGLSRERFAGPDMVSQMFTTVAVPPMVSDLLDLSKRWRADVIVHEEAEYAAPLVAELLGIPCVTHSWAAPARPVEERADLLDLMKPIRAGRAASQTRLSGSRYLDACPPLFQSDAVRSIPGVQPIRALPFDGPTTAHPHWLSELRSPAAYVSFGTVRQFSRPPVLQSTVDAVAQAVSSTVVTTGPNPPASLHVSRGSIFVEQYLPQSVVLPCVDVVVSHGGAGTTLGAIMYGLPHVVVPQQPWSQRRNAERIAELGIGLHVEDQNPEALRRAVASALADPALKTAAARVREAMFELPAPDVVLAQLLTDLA